MSRKQNGKFGITKPPPCMLMFSICVNSRERSMPASATSFICVVISDTGCEADMCGHHQHCGCEAVVSINEARDAELILLL